ncbi:hypothetical protein SISSUDRAFT_1000846 [Sistotremastrum suecicum HHB10207 ss-3]|uniref:protein-tyrosine-phosphatase n=1 Tax=Sistotremastrum suecicum HHB10207 ss-3 TaxID=1314776 RepID=A0A166G6D7_9AGAM|nr:hypothetical protein SISSUDRAFT_1000846 [Sistotremastrum suecicum HHB10207 ss-3]
MSFNDPRPVVGPPRPGRNLKKLSLTLPTVSDASTASPMSAIPPDSPVTQIGRVARKRPSTMSLPAPSVSAALHRRDEAESPSAPYIDGPVQILPGIWLGAEENVRDWPSLISRGIRAILNVAKEVSSPFDSLVASLRMTASTSDLSKASHETTGTYYPPHPQTGRPGMHYLKLPWSHGQTDLVREGFPAAMAFVDQALDRGDGVIIHCQCGVSRSATLAIALVMRAAALSLPTVPPEIWALKSAGMHGAYAFVKDKSKWVGPNMSLIYQLLDYERTFHRTGSPTPSDRSSLAAEDDEEWSRRRMAMEEDDMGSPGDDEKDDMAYIREARALDQEMEDRIVAKKASNSSLGSQSSLGPSTGSGVGMGPAWRNRYALGSRHRTGSISSNLTTQSSILSEDLLEEDEDDSDDRGRSGGRGASRFSPDTADTDEDVHMFGTKPQEEPQSLLGKETPRATLSLPPSAGGRLRTSPPPLLVIPTSSAPASRQTFSAPSGHSSPKNFAGVSKPKAPKKRPPPLVSVLPTVPSSPGPATAPIHSVPKVQSLHHPQEPIHHNEDSDHAMPMPRTRHTKPPPSALPLQAFPKMPVTMSSAPTFPPSKQIAYTPSQTLFVFPSSPSFDTSTPSTLTLMTPTPSTFSGRISNQNRTLASSRQSTQTPRVSSFKKHGRTRSFVGPPPAPTMAYSIVDVRGVMGSASGAH